MQIRSGQINPGFAMNPQDFRRVMKTPQARAKGFHVEITKEDNFYIASLKGKNNKIALQELDNAPWAKPLSSGLACSAREAYQTLALMVSEEKSIIEFSKSLLKLRLPKILARLRKGDNSKSQKWYANHLENLNRKYETFS